MHRKHEIKSSSQSNRRSSDWLAVCTHTQQLQSEHSLFLCGLACISFVGKLIVWSNMAGRHISKQNNKSHFKVKHYIYTKCSKCCAVVVESASVWAM